MSLLALALFAQLALPSRTTLPVLAVPERGLDDGAAYQGYETRLFRDAAGNTVQIYLDARAERVVHLWADAEDESFGFTARRPGGGAAVLRWDGPGARVGRSAATRTLEHALVADGPRIDIGWFLLGSMRVERDLQYDGRQRAPFAEGPYRLAEIERLLTALASLEPTERARHLALLHADSVGALRERTRPALTMLNDGALRVVRVAQPALDGLDTLVLELRTDPRRVATEVVGDSVMLRSRAGRRIPFSIRVSTNGRALTPLTRGEMFTAPFLDYVAESRSLAERRGVARDVAQRARRVERQVRGLELLASREKLMAGLPTYATYFGRDMLMTALMMRPVWLPAMSEAVIGSALRKLGPDGRVSHEEALGGQAVREAASEYASLVTQASAAGTRRAASDSLLARARTVLRDLRRVRENYHMIDAEFQLPIVVGRWLSDAGVSAARKRAFLLDTVDAGEPRVARLIRELALVARITAPYAERPLPDRLISFAARDSGRWASQSWRDSEVGYARGRYAMDVNAIWAPRALESVGIIFDALRAIGLSPDSLARVSPEMAGRSALGRYAREPASLRQAVDRWMGASRHFLVTLSPAEVGARTAARLAAMPEAEQRHWANVLTQTRADGDSLQFLALSLDAAGHPIAVANSDVATRLFLGERERSGGVPDAAARAEVLRDVRLFVRRYPVGLLVDNVGPVVANDAYASSSVWRDFERDRYHGPRVVWGRENNLFLIGAMNRVAEARGHFPELAEYRREVGDAIDQVLGAVDASGFHSELWSYELRDGRIVPVRYGSGSDVQLWSTTDLVVGYARSRMAR
ncbi:MAG: hypothetical protein ABIP93_09910 [Gemmatimonadaceae bacterium]